MNANDMEKTIEIPFGAKDSELKGWEYTIPENMEAEIKDGKIIVKQKESEDERIRRMIIEQMIRWKKCAEENDVEQDIKDASAAIAYLERKKKQKLAEPDWCHHKVDLSGCSEEYMKGYYDGWNNCNQQHAQCEAEQKPAEWSDDFQENIRILLHDKLTWHSDDGKMSSAVLIDDKTLKDIISGIWFYVGKEALKYPKKELSQPEWSEEDEKMRASIVMTLAGFMGNEEKISWLNSIHPQAKIKWSEEDETMLQMTLAIIETLEDTNNAKDGFLDVKDWLKSLRPQPHWKPSEDGGTEKHPWNDEDVEKAYREGMKAGAEWQREQYECIPAEEEYMRGFAQGAKEERKDLTPIINRLCEAILFEWKDAADLARKTLTQIKAQEE